MSKITQVYAPITDLHDPNDIARLILLKSQNSVPVSINPSKFRSFPMSQRQWAD